MTFPKSSWLFSLSLLSICLWVGCNAHSPQSEPTGRIYQIMGIPDGRALIMRAQDTTDTSPPVLSLVTPRGNTEWQQVLPMKPQPAQSHDWFAVEAGVVVTTADFNRKGEYPSWGHMTLAFDLETGQELWRSDTIAAGLNRLDWVDQHSLSCRMKMSYPYVVTFHQFEKKEEGEISGYSYSELAVIAYHAQTGEILWENRESWRPDTLKMPEEDPESTRLAKAYLLPDTSQNYLLGFWAAAIFKELDLVWVNGYFGPDVILDLKTGQQVQQTNIIDVRLIGDQLLTLMLPSQSSQPIEVPTIGFWDPENGNLQSLSGWDALMEQYPEYALKRIVSSGSVKEQPVIQVRLEKDYTHKMDLIVGLDLANTSTDWAIPIQADTVGFTLQDNLLTQNCGRYLPAYATYTIFEQDMEGNYLGYRGGVKFAVLDLEKKKIQHLYSNPEEEISLFSSAIHGNEVMYLTDGEYGIASFDPKTGAWIGGFETLDTDIPLFSEAQVAGNFLWLTDKDYQFWALNAKTLKNVIGNERYIEPGFESFTTRLGWPAAQSK